ncbi:neuraminidase-like domain-containing protein [Pseudomonas abietaniphila]|uniref:Uncharacterized protein n=1 Tax=Pseudomonas abietaniphila TaxID=89065 RepID=A0A1G8JGU8_9PSED|nr:neuraminidase-like domain-containing protein [Pseudomonas abietaniphila]SDI30509.1 hypothetical protein SAMN05216605_11254 [Pseudomonas abietaniphila]
MSSLIERQLNESFRDALVSYYLSEVVPNHGPIVDLGLDNRLITANDLYEYLLLDVQVSQLVETSYVASAISSIQQYINAVLMGMEPGYSSQVLNANQLAEWRDQRSQYPIWAANQKLQYYPELYIDPMLRLHKSGYFQQLETDINQSKIEVDTVQEAVNAYLASFEEVANLSVINGYIDSNDFATGTYYFVGKSRAEQQYYWRSVVMNDRPVVDGVKSDYPNPGAWSDWKKANVGITPHTLEHTIRPVYFNNRLFVTWVDRTDVMEALGSAGEVVPTPKVRLAMHVSYKKYDDSWSAPHAYIDVTVLATELKDDLDSISVFDNSHSPQGLFLAVYANKQGSGYSFWRICLVDKNFQSQALDANDAGPVSTVKEIFSATNAGRMQFQVNPAWNIVSFNDIPTPNDDRFDYGVLKSSLAELTAASFDFDLNRGRLKFSPVVKQRVSSGEFIVDVVIVELIVWVKFTLSIFLTDDLEDGWSILDERSSLVNTLALEVPYGFGFGTEGLILLKSPSGEETFELTGNLSLKNFRINLAYFASLTNFPIVLPFRRAFPPPTFMSSDCSLMNKVRWWFGYASDLENISNATLEETIALLPLWYVAANEFRTINIDLDAGVGVPADGYSTVSGAINIVYGLQCVQSESVLGAGLKCVELKIGLTAPRADQYISPRIASTLNGSFGIAEYVDFSGSTIVYSDGSSTKLRKPIRMNTLFARELVNTANIALEKLLSWDTQQLAEPPLPGETSPKMDFHGANSLYFWELFFHLPLMVAQRLNLERQFDGSDLWLGFIFEPARTSDTTGRPDYWNVRPLEEDSVRDYAMRMPVDPDGIASSQPLIYKKATYGYYIKNLIDRGDAAYRQLTPDSLTEAKLWYVRVLDLLGPRPDTLLINDWTPLTLMALSAENNSELRAFAEQLNEQDERRQASAAANGGVSRLHFKQQPLRLSTYTADPMAAEVDNPHFRVPMNAELVRHWDTVESRLYNLRHNLTLDGKPMSLPLFAAPLDPRALLAAFADGGTGGGLATLMGQEVGHYRFATLYNHATAAVETLIQFGSTLLSLLERKEASELQEIQQHQALELAQFSIELQEQTQLLEAESRKALLASQKIADQRALFYYQLVDEGVSVGERAASASHSFARVMGAVSSISQGLAVCTQVSEFIAGFSTGNFKALRVPVQMAATFGTAASEEASMIGDILDRSESYRRREEEWQHAYDQACLESAQIDAQLKVYDEQELLTAKQLSMAKSACAQAKANYEFLGKRFTQSQLYEWLNSQMSSFYYQAYDATMSLCLAAEASWQFERADFSTRFVRPSAWSGSRRGLLAGESLKLDLLKMNTAYLTRNERLLEIVKTVSVRQLPVSTEDVPTLNTGWANVLERLDENGIAEFELTKAMLDDDYPNHYLRRIKRISVSLPVTVGPYQDIRAILTQTYSAVHLAPGADVPPRENLRASQQIAVSTGVDDDGLFVFNFDDERYLPFEGTGVISRWTLEFPNPELQREMIDSITDIIVHVRYTAKSGGSVTTRSRPARISKARAQKPQ